MDLFGTTLRDFEASAHAVLEDAIRRHNPSHVVALLSGGDDSLASAHIASLHPRFAGCIHIDTEIGIRETGEFVEDAAYTHRWGLKIYRPGEAPDHGLRGREPGA